MEDSSFPFETPRDPTKEYRWPMKLGMITYEVIFLKDGELVPGEAANVQACIKHDRRVVYLRNLANEGVMHTVLMHEAVHALSDQLGLGLSENKVRPLAVALVRLLEDNPLLAHCGVPQWWLNPQRYGMNIDGSPLRGEAHNEAHPDHPDKE